MKNNNFFEKLDKKRPLCDRPVVLGCAGCAMAHPDFGRSVNPISTRGDRLCPPNYYRHTRIFRPSDGPESINALFYLIMSHCFWTVLFN